MNFVANHSFSFPSRRAVAVAIVFAAVLSLNAAESPVKPAAEEPAAPAGPLGAPLPQSVFVDDATSGKDPFYPNSMRRSPVAKITKAGVPVADPNRIQLLTLKGITGPNDRRLALINNLTFVAGETGNVRTAGGLVKIRVLEVGEKSVTVAIEGEPGRHELKLRELAGTPLATGN
ncbi:MAG: hypothetical protein HY301_19745 [Verrucomicrobia bacterium]|nr:hypothetical protein [Verrucomicrobiota bacterium]